MAYDYSASLNPQKALIWRIVHRDNIPWILDNGLHCGNSLVQAENWINIGNPELIGKRAGHPVPVGTGGTLHDYVPFYFTPFSPMLMNIHSGRGGIKQRPMRRSLFWSATCETWQHTTYPSCLPTAMLTITGPTTTPVWIVWTRSTGPFCRHGTFAAIQTIRLNLNAIRQRR